MPTQPFMCCGQVGKKLGKILSVCGQHEIQYTEYGISKCTYKLCVEYWCFSVTYVQ